VVTTRNLLIALIVGAAALLVAASTITTTSDHAARGPTSGPSSQSISTRPQPAQDSRSRSSSASARRRTPPHKAQSKPAGTAPSQAAAPAAGNAFGLVVHTRSGDIAAPVDPVSVASNEPVDPPLWNTAVWVEQSSYPSKRSKGTSYVYGHACHHHVCSFTRLKEAAVGDPVTVATRSGTLTYRIARIGLSPKTASSLPEWASDSSVADRIVLVTCAYENGDNSTDNIVVVADLQR
jgi:LPXTG-site transpeptidase (sortase) family protein